MTLWDAVWTVTRATPWVTYKGKPLIAPTRYISEVSNVISDLVWRQSIRLFTVPVRTDP